MRKRKLNSIKSETVPGKYSYATFVYQQDTDCTPQFVRQGNKQRLSKEHVLAAFTEVNIRSITLELFTTNYCYFRVVYSWL